MSRLLWKEIREKWVWGVLIAASTCVVVLLAHGIVVGERKPELFALPAFVALLYGLSAYSSEIARGCAEFIESRGISRWQLLLSKLVVAVGFVTAAVLAGVILSRITLPAEYVPFFTLTALIKTVWLGVLVMVASFVVGISASVVLPGTAGGLVVMLGLALVTGLVTMAFTGFTDLSHTAISLKISMSLAAVYAMLHTVRRGLLRPQQYRIYTYAGSYLFAYALAAVSLLLTQDVWIWRVPFQQVTQSSASPGGKYAIIKQSLWDNEDNSRFLMVRFSDGKALALRREVAEWEDANTISPTLDLSKFMNVYDAKWSPSGTAYTDLQEGLYLSRINKNGSLDEKYVRMPGGTFLPSLLPSPSGKILMYVGVSDEKIHKSNPGKAAKGSEVTQADFGGKKVWFESKTCLSFLDLETWRIMGPTIEGITGYKWMPGDVVWYQDTAGVENKVKI